MNAKRTYAILALASLSIMTATGADAFPSIEKAMTGFATNTVSAQERACEYVLGKAKTMNGLNAKTILQALKTITTMAVDLSNVVVKVENIVRERGTLSPAHRVEIARAVADVRIQKFADTRGALKLIEEAIPLVENDKVSEIQLRLKRMDVLRGAKMNDEVEKEAKIILASAECPPQSYQTASYVLADLATTRKDAKTAGEILLDVIRKMDPVPAGIAKRLVDANLDKTTLGAAVVAMRKRLAEMPLDDATVFKAAVERTQPEIVELLNHMGCCDEALAECRVLVLTASPKSYQGAVNLTAASLKRADGNLSRAMAFMEFQKKGFVPAERNIILDAPALADEVRTEARKSLPVGMKERWTESLAVSARLVWLDDPLGAVEEAMRAFALAPFDNKSLQTCADAVMQPILTVTRDPQAAKGIVDYLMHGPAGADGKKGTQDDLPSPFKDLSAVLKLGSGK